LQIGALMRARDQLDDVVGQKLGEAGDPWLIRL
jgi:hypothetical protein